MRSIGSNFIQTILVLVPTIILGIGTGIFLTRALGPEGKGEYTFILANVELFTLFFCLGSENGIVYFNSNKQISTSRLGGIILYVYTFAIVSFILLLFIDYFIPTGYIFDKDKRLGIYAFMLLYFLLGLINTFCSSFIRSILQFKIVNRINLFISSMNFLVFGIVYFLSTNYHYTIRVDDILLGSFFMLLLNAIIWVYFYVRLVGVAPSFLGLTCSEFKTFFKYNFIGYLGMMVNFLNYKIDIWFLGYYSTDKKLGFYSTAVNTAQFLLLFSRTLSMILQPYLSKFDPETRLKQFIIYSRINFSVVLFSALLLFPFGPFFIKLLFGSNFEGSIDSFQILLLAMLFLCSNQLIYIFYASSNLNPVNLKANLLGVIVCISLNAILIPNYDIIGASWTSFFCYLSIFIFLYISYLRQFPKSSKNIFIARKLDFQELFKLK